jgi:kynurenine formamidase
MKASVSAIGLSIAMFGTGALACTPEDYSGCKGRAWVDGDKMETPLGAKWWPHPIWGAGDEAGSTNWYTKPEVVKRAVGEVKQGKSMKIGHVYTADMPLFGARKWSLRIPGAPTGGPFGPNRVMWYDEFLATEIGQVGTQFDGLGHIGVGVGKSGDKNEMRFYNGVTVSEMEGAYGLRKLGAEKLNPIIARGIMIDVAAAKGVDVLKDDYQITMADVKEALRKQGMADFKFMEGDAVVFRTGWTKYWITDNARYNKGCPGIGMEVARWLAEEVKAGVWGADTWPTEVVPNPDPACVFCVHQYMLARHGIVNQENLNLDGISKEKVYRFMYTYSPSPIQGATGSNGSPVATW